MGFYYGESRCGCNNNDEYNNDLGCNNSSYNNNCDCDSEYFEELFEKYLDIQEVSDNNAEEALEELREAINNLKKVEKCNCEANKVGDKIDKWLENCEGTFSTSYSQCKCDNLREKLDKLIEKKQSLQNESLCYAKKAERKLQESKAVNECLEELLETISENCYPELYNNCDFDIDCEMDYDLECNMDCDSDYYSHC